MFSIFRSTAATRGAWLGLVPFVLATAAVQAAPDASALPLDAFFKNAEFEQPQLSPSGRYVGVLAGSDHQRTRLLVLDLDANFRVSVAAVFDDADIRNFHWLNDERLVFDIADRRDDAAERKRPRGVWGVNRDGGAFRQLIESAWPGEFAPLVPAKHILPGNWALRAVPDDGSPDIVVEEFRFNTHGDVEATSVRRMNTLTGILRSVLATDTDSGPRSLGEPSGTVGWFFDAAAHPAFVTTVRGGRSALYRRNPQGGDWKLFTEFDTFLGSSLDPIDVDASGALYLTTPDARGHDALFRWDEARGKPDEVPLIRFDGFDFAGHLVFDKGRHRLLGVHYLADVPRTVWFDEEMQALQREVDWRLPDLINRVSCQDCKSRVLIASSSDRQPTFFHLYDRANDRLLPLFSTRPWIDAERMGHVEFIRYKARDGRDIPAYVTTPAAPSSGPRPAVVLVHGGPWLRGGNGGWEAEAQFLASRGYLVIEPEFRGSTGFGFDHFRAGWRQWGLAMQDDLDDALAWAVAEHRADPQRACIAGASYGGYAALMGLVREPSPFRCAVEWAGVSDIDLMFDPDAFGGTRWAAYGMRRLIGDPDRDAAQLRATSPLQQAAKIRKPLLMAYGESDLTVPLKHGTELRAALARSNPDVEWVSYPNESHGWTHLETRLDFWGRVDRFLARRLEMPP